MDEFKNIIGLSLVGLVVLYGLLKVSLLFFLTPRSRHELGYRLAFTFILFGLLLAICALSKDITFKNLFSQKFQLGFILMLGTMLLLVISFYRNCRLKFKGQETTLLHRTEKYLNLLFDGGSLHSWDKDRKLYEITYQFKVNEKTYSSKKYILSGKISYLTRVLYDPANPSKNIPVPGASLDNVRY